MKHLADTHILIWWLTGDAALSQPHKLLIQSAESKGVRIGVSAMSLWEIAKLNELGRITLAGSIDEFLRDIESSELFEVLPITAVIAAESTRLGPAFPRDPSDQVIAATARCHALSLITSDGRMRASKVVALV